MMTPWSFLMGILLCVSSCTKDIGPYQDHAAYHRLKDGLDRLVTLRSEHFSTRAGQIDFNARSNTIPVSRPDGTVYGTYLDPAFIQPIEEYAELLGFDSALDAHEWYISLGKAIDELRSIYRPKDHMAFLRQLTQSMIEDLQVDEPMRRTESFTCFMHFQQSAFLKYCDFGAHDSQTNQPAKTHDGNLSAIYGEGSAINMLAKMIMALTDISST